MPLYKVIKTYEVEAVDEKEARDKIFLLEETNQAWLLLMGVRTQEIPWPTQDEMESYPNLSDRRANAE